MTLTWQSSGWFSQTLSRGSQAAWTASAFTLTLLNQSNLAYHNNMHYMFQVKRPVELGLWNTIWIKIFTHEGMLGLPSLFIIIHNLLNGAHENWRPMTLYSEAQFQQTSWQLFLTDLQTHLNLTWTLHTILGLSILEHTKLIGLSSLSMSQLSYISLTLIEFPLA